MLRSYCGTQYRYDERGNLLERIESGKTGKFTWDLFDRLRRYEDDRLVVEFSYDALGRRVYKDSRSKYRNRVQAGPVWNENARRALDEKLGCDLTLFIWDGDTLAFEQRGRDGKGQTTHYVFEPGTFVPIAQGVMNHIEEMLHQPKYVFPYNINYDPAWQHYPTPKIFDSFTWHQCDNLGTPHELSNNKGEIWREINLKSWGETASNPATTGETKSTECNIRLQGQYFDTETNLHYNRYRYYSPHLGRFIGKDPIGFRGELNVYQFAPNPIEWIEPLGLCPCLPPCLDGGSYREMLKSAKGYDTSQQLDAHHLPQQAYNRTIGLSKGRGPSVLMTHDAHGDTRTWGGRGKTSMREDIDLNARQRMAKDVRDLRNLFGRDCNEAALKSIRYAKTLPEFQKDGK